MSVRVILGSARDGTNALPTHAEVDTAVKSAIARAVDTRIYPYVWSSFESLLGNLRKSHINEDRAIEALRVESDNNNATVVIFYAAYADHFPHDDDNLRESWTFGLFLAVLCAMTTTERKMENPSELEAIGLDPFNIRNIARNLRALHARYPQAVGSVAALNRGDLRKAARTRCNLRRDDLSGVARVMDILVVCATRVMLLMEMEIQ